MMPKDTTPEPRVSIMIPTYNQSRVITRAVESALAQDYPNLEVIVSDDRSTDETKQVIEPYLTDTRLKYFRNARNLGRTRNYQCNLRERVTGTWALNLDGDDYLHDSGVISTMISARVNYRDENVVAIFGVQKTRNIPLGISTELPARCHAGLCEGAEIFLGWPYTQFGHLATMYKVDLARQIDYYRLDTISSDWESILRLILHGKVVVVNRLIGVWNIHGSNVSAAADIDAWILDYSYIEEAARYAVQHGVTTADATSWLRAMVRFHTKSIWNSNMLTSAKVKVLVPFLAHKYLFAIPIILNPRSLAQNLLRTHPELYNRTASFYRQQTRRQETVNGAEPIER